MKQFIAAIVALVITFSITSCKKGGDVVPAEKPTIIGFWQGGYSTAGGSSGDFAFLFRANGTLRAYSNNADTTKANKAEGSYQVSGSTVSATYTYIVSNQQYTASAAINSEFKNLAGQWKDYGSPTFIGTFSMEKK